MGVNAGQGRRAQLHVRIDELRLEGFESRNRFRIAQAVEHELARLLRARARDGAREPPRDSERIDGGSFSFRPDDPPQLIGAAIARATFRGLTGATTGRGHSSE
jgi:hypothetical protein